jgi:hypothetical protein
VAGDSAMPASDGVTNLVKYAFGLDPYLYSAIPESLAHSGGSSQFIFNRPATRPDLTYAVQVSPSLASGSWTSNGVSLLQTGFGDPQTWQATYTTGTALKYFFRLQITGP